MFFFFITVKLNSLSALAFVKILVGLPTFNNGASGYTIRRTLEALTDQSYHDFKLLIVYKPSSGDKTLDIVDEFRDKLDIEVKIQSDGFVEEAMNEIFKASTDYDITLTTDDDAIPAKTWIKEHVQLHKNHEKIGITQGMVNPQEYECYEYLRFVKNLIGYYKPLTKELHNYAYVVNDMGLFVCKKPKLLSATRNYEYIYTLGIAGVNMSFKSGQLIDGFTLPGYIKRGLRYETLLALYYIKQGFYSIIFNGGFVKHLERYSLTRSRDEVSKFMINIEDSLLPYGVHYYGFKINMYRLRLYERLIKLYSIFRRTTLSRIYVIGLNLAIEAIENNYKPKEVRDRLLEIEREVRARYG